MLIIIQELDLESCPVNVKDVYCAHVGISAEEHLLGLSLFLWIYVLGDYHLDLPFEAHGPDRGRMQGEALPSNGLKDGLVQRLEIHGAGEFLRPPFLPRLRAIVQVLQTDIVPRRLITLKPSVLAPVTKVSLEKKASATRQLDNLRRSSLRECMVLR